MPRPLPRLLLASTALLALGWTVYVLAGDALAGVLADRLRGAVRAATDGKLRDAAPFFLHRLRDALVIAAAIVGAWALNWAVVPRVSKWKGAWLPLGALFFVEANVILAVMARTGLFWFAMYAGGSAHDVSRFYVRQAIATDANAERLVGIIGSSQAGTQIDEDQINEALGDDLYAAQLNFPAAKPYSLLLLQDDLERVRPDALVLYLSEVSFLRGTGLEHLPLFASAGALSDFARLGGEADWDRDRVRNGWISAAVPAYRLRSPLSQRFLGRTSVPRPAEMNLPDDDLPNPKAIQDIAEDDPIFQAELERRARLLIYGEPVDFQYRALEVFAQRADAAGIDLYLLPGTVHPALEARLPEGTRAQMLSVLRGLGERYERVHYVEEARLPRLEHADFKDPAHGSKRGQERFTAGLVEVLREEILGETPVRPDSLVTVASVSSETHQSDGAAR
ncbi:MAG: hypothetical protein AAGI52_07100 [Bacteroidota bacterium]